MMILNEQIYKKKKLYYHGSPDGGFTQNNPLKPVQISRTNTKVLYITQDPIYAYKNYVKENGFLYVLRLIRPLNIFNANSKIDLAKLLKYTDLSKMEINILKKHDWMFFSNFDIPGGHFSNKSDLIEIIKKLGFDGFYNNENVENEFFKLDGIGLFVDNAIEIIAKYSAEEAIQHIKKLNKYSENKKEIELVNDFLKESGLTKEKRKLWSLNRRLIEFE